MTFSVAARCKDTGMFGTVVTSSSICVASRCAFSRANVGAFMSQNITNPNLGSLGLDLMEHGHSINSVLELTKESEPHIDWRQLGMIDAKGETAVFSGSETLGIYASAQGDNCVAQGNMLANTTIPQAMISVFENSEGHLAKRLLKAVKAGLNAGGEMGPVYSAGLKVVDQVDWPVVDLRVDWHIAPIHELEILWQVYQPQMQAYIERALDPANSKAYDAPGDDRS